MNGFDHFGKKAIVMFIVKKCKLFEAVKPSSCILDEHLNCAQNGHEVNKIDFLRVHQLWIPWLKTMNNELHFLYDSLISVLRNEVDVYSKIHKCFLNERKILAGSSVDELYESNSRKETCILKARMVEEARTKIVERIINILNLDGKVLNKDRSLSTLLLHGDDNQKRDLEECQSALKSLLMDIHGLNERNKTLLDSSLFYVRKSIDFLGQLIYPDATYMSTGRLKSNNLNGKILRRQV